MARMPNRSDVEAAVDAAVELGKAQAKALAALPGAITAIAEAAKNINATATEARAVIRKAQAVTDRLDSMLDHVEPAVSELTPTLQALKEAQQRIVAMTGSTEKMASFVEDAGAGLSRLAGMSGASGLFSRIAAATKPAEPAGGRSLAAVRAELVAADEPDVPAEEFLAELVETPVPATHAEEGIEDADIVQPEGSAGEAPTGDAVDGAPALTDAPIFDAVAEVVPVELPTAHGFPAQVSEGDSSNEDGTDAGAAEQAASTEAAGADASEHDEAGHDEARQDEARHYSAEAQVDAALEPVELGSEADGPDEDAQPS